MFKAIAPVYNVLFPNWHLLSELPELIRIYLDVKYFDLVVSENKQQQIAPLTL